MAETQSEFELVSEAAAWLKARLPYSPTAGIVLGTGLGKWTESLQVDYSVAFNDVPHLVPSSVDSHKGTISLVRFGEIPVIIFSGRIHYYEGFSLEEVVRPVRLMHLLGCKNFITTNAAGGINPNYKAGDIVLIRDHINLPQMSPLRGPNDDRLGLRFPDMAAAYDEDLLLKMKSLGKKENIKLRSGTYVWVTGPQLETAAEYEWLFRIGADVVGMSAVPEVIAARHAGMKVLGVSVVSNECYPRNRVTDVSIEAVIQMVESKALVLGRLLEKMLSDLN